MVDDEVESLLVRWAQRISGSQVHGGDPALTLALAQAERRLGVSLPPSYRAFLSMTPGWPAVGLDGVGLAPATEIAWLRDRGPLGIIEVYCDPSYGIPPDVLAKMRSEYESLLLVSIPSVTTTQLFLLNPQVTTAAGEWEAWSHSHWNPGEIRYPSFVGLLAQQYATMDKLDLF